MQKRNSITTPTRSRLCIYFFYDPQGIIDEYVFDCLRDIARNVNRILFVSNSPLDKEAQQKLRHIDHLDITIRSNEGFDVWAYKHGIDTLGWGTILEYDEVIFMNFTIVGPLYPLANMFESMDKRDVDFWGINVHSGEDYDPWGVMEDGFIPKHIQSHFIAVRKKMLKSLEFRSYWDNMRPILSYQEAIGHHEAVFTQNFEKLGYKWESYVDTSDLEEMVSYPLMFMPREVILNRKSPFFKRKALLLTMDQYIGITAGEPVTETVETLKHIGYDIGKVMPNILRTGNQYDIRMAYGPFTIIPKDTKSANSIASDRRLIVAYVDTQVKMRALSEYIVSILQIAKLTIVISPKMNMLIESQFEHHENLEIIRGNYIELIKIVGSSKNKYMAVGVIGMSSYSNHRTMLSEYDLYKHGLSALFSGKTIVEALTSRMLEDKIVGVYAAPQSVHGDYGDESYPWHINYSATRSLLGKIGVTVNVDRQKPALSSESGMFWLKPDVFNSVSINHLYDGLAKMSDSRASRIFSFALPFIAQQSGYLMTYAAPDSVTSNFVMGLLHRKAQQQAMIASLLAQGAPKTSPPARIYYVKDGLASEKYKVTFPLIEEKDGSWSAKASMPVSSNSIRFDPIEGRGIICEGIKIAINGQPRRIVARNAISYRRGLDIFLVNDPQYRIEGGVKKGDKIFITIEKVQLLSQLPQTDIDFAIKQMKEHYEKKIAIASHSYIYLKVRKAYHLLRQSRK